jgi:FimV-like protein
VAAGGHKKGKLLYGFITTLSVAAAIVIVFWGSRYYIDYRHTTRLADEYATAFVMEPAATRGTGDEEVARTMSRLFASVRSGKRLPVVQDRLSKLWKLSLQPTYNDYTPYSSLIGWNLAIAYLKNNDKTRAREVLTVLASHADSDAVRAKAAELLAKLE